MSTTSSGDPRVLFVMNLVLSATFATLVTYGLGLITPFTFSWRAAAIGTGALMVLTYLLVLR